MESPTNIVLSEQPHSEANELRSEDHSQMTDLQFQNFVSQQAGEVQRQWAECHKRSHRGRIFRTAAVIALTIGLTTLRIALVVSLINRVSMIHLVLRGVDLMFITICLKYIALVDYSLCLCRMNNRPESRVKLKSVFAIELHQTTKRTALYVWTLLFLGGPLYILGIDLALFDSNSL
ncbi:hypothetical protein FBUS_10801 [Fasciolopsis buskii]|uniref:Uncharacterized protein n=1 Tax=Fasciolopsis buskii TaxID=27845 RepID=A0A8E0RWM3_9TREM|nr:hypothetical protein FBUS_10801 [Fasciolopsis buski]